MTPAPVASSYVVKNDEHKKDHYSAVFRRIASPGELKNQSFPDCRSSRSNNPEQPMTHKNRHSPLVLRLDASVGGLTTREAETAARNLNIITFHFRPARTAQIVSDL
jgi:hypothetical protein